jgi:nucleotide-binding universal stress UspA family protein
MHVIVATDGSKQSLAAARYLKSFADPSSITDVSVVAVVRPLASVAFADELSDSEQQASWDTLSFREAAENAVAIVAAAFDGWGPKVHERVRSGSPANEIIKAAKQHEAGLVVVAAGGRGISSSVLVGSTAQRVQHYAPCPVLVVRPKPRKSQKASKAKRS